MTALLLESLPQVRGSYRANAALKGTNWFRVGGPAEVLFKPADTQDLAEFLRQCPREVPVTVIGVGSNLIVRDGGLDGVVIRLGRGFTEICVACKTGPHPNSLPEGEGVIEAGAAALDVHVAQVAAEAGCDGLAFLSGIPGTIGGALAMNGGAYGREMQEVLIAAEWVRRDGTVERVMSEQLNYRYRGCELPEGAIFTRCWLKTKRGDPATILAEIARINEARASTQPIRSRTGGSTFKNPVFSEGEWNRLRELPGFAEMKSPPKAWELIDKAGCRGLTMGGAQMSELHCNFMLNTGEATAADLEALGEEVRNRVKAHSGVELQWEIKRIGKRL